MYKISHLSINNFMSIKQAEIDFDIGDNMILVTGYDHKKKCSNGSGKTSIMDAILFSKYGTVLKGGARRYAITIPELVHYYDYNSVMQTRIDLVNTLDNNKISVEKSIKNADKLQSVIKTRVYENDSLIQGGFKSSREYDKYLKDHILQFDLESFYRLHVFYGSNYVHFFSLPIGTKVDIMENFITLTPFGDISKAMGKDIYALNKEISDMDYLLNRKKDEKMIIKRHSDRYKEMTIASLKKDISEKRQKVLELEVISKVNKDKKARIEKDLLDKNYDSIAMSLTDNRSKFSEQRIRVKSKIKGYDNILNSKFSLLGDTVLECPLCMQRLENKKSIEDHLNSVKEDKKKGEIILDKLEKSIVDCDNEIRKIAADKVRLSNIIDDIGNSIRRDEISIDLFTKDIERMENQIENIDSFHDEDITKKQSIIYKDMIGIVKDARVKRYERRKLNFLSSLTSHRSDFKKPLLQDYLYMLSVLVNKYIKELWENDDISVEVIMKPNDNDIDLVLDDGRRYIGLSAGEQRTVDIATLLSFMEMASMIKRTNIGYILVDELVEHLSTPLAYKCVKLMSDFVRESGIQCFFISHNAIMEDQKVVSECFDRHLRIEKGLDGISRVVKNEQI